MRTASSTTTTTTVSRYYLWLVVATLVVVAQGQTVPPGGVVATGVPGAVVATAPPLGTTTPLVAVTSPPETQPEAAADGTPAPTEYEGFQCIDPQDIPTAKNKVEIGEKTTICIVLGSSKNWNQFPQPPGGVHYLRLSFQPFADQYSRFFVKGSYRDMLYSVSEIFTGSNDVTIHVSSGKSLSFQRIFYQAGPPGTPGQGKIYPHLTAIIDVNKGDVVGITWDDACLFCNDAKCLENTYDFNGNSGDRDKFGQPTRGCYIEEQECNKAAIEKQNELTKCDITVYFVWTGTDVNGKAFQSSSYRFSSFPEQNIKDRFFDASGVTSQINEIQNNIQENIPGLGAGGDQTPAQDGA